MYGTVPGIPQKTSGCREVKRLVPKVAGGPHPITFDDMVTKRAGRRFMAQEHSVHGFQSTPGPPSKVILGD